MSPTIGEEHMAETNSDVVSLVTRYLDESFSTDDRLKIRRELAVISEDLLAPALITLAKGDDTNVRGFALQILLRNFQSIYLDFILSYLDSEDAGVRGIICYEIAIGSLEDLDARLLAPLTKVAKSDPVSDVRYWAVVALGSLGERSVLDTLVWVKDNDKGANYEEQSIASGAQTAILEILSR